MIFWRPFPLAATCQVFLNRNAFGDWLDTWTVDYTDPQALWQLVPAPCGEYNCTQPDYEEHYNEYMDSTATPAPCRLLPAPCSLSTWTVRPLLLPAACSLLPAP